MAICQAVVNMSYYGWSKFNLHRFITYSTYNKYITLLVSLKYHSVVLPPASLLNIFSANNSALGQPAIRVINSYLVTVMWPGQTDQHTVALCSQVIKTHDSLQDSKTTLQQTVKPFCCTLLFTYQPMCTEKWFSILTSTQEAHSWTRVSRLLLKSHTWWNRALVYPLQKPLCWYIQHPGTDTKRHTMS